MPNPGLDDLGTVRQDPRPSVELARMTTPSDADLIERCLSGERDAWEVLVDRYVDVIYRIARGTGLEAAGAEDTTQEVCLVLLKHLHRLRSRELLLPWIVQVTRRTAWRQTRRARATVRREEKVARPERASGVPALESLAAIERQHLVRRAFGTISEKCRRLLDALFFQPERSYAELAPELGMPVGSIGPTRKRCLAKLRLGLESVGLAPPDGDVSETTSAATPLTRPDASRRSTS